MNMGKISKNDKIISFNHDVVGVQESYGDLDVLVSDKIILFYLYGEKIGYCEYSFGCFDFPVIEFVILKQEYRGKGFADTIYDFLVHKFGGIISDSVHSKGTRNVWDRLKARQDVFAFDFNDKRILDKDVDVYKNELRYICLKRK